MNEYGYFLDKREGKLYVRYEFTVSTRPLRRRLWWPIGSWAGDPRTYDRTPIDELIGKPLRDCFTFKDQFRGGGWIFILRDGATTQPEFAEAEPVPPPKTKLPVEWRFGRWEKLTKKKGWVPA